MMRDLSTQQKNCVVYNIVLLGLLTSTRLTVERTKYQLVNLVLEFSVKTELK